jgi:hypothetical protein
MTWLEGRRVTAMSEGPESGSLQWRASRVFKVMAVIGFAGIILSLLPDSFPNSTLLTVAFNWAAALVSVVYLLEARGIDRGEFWAIVATRPLLLLLGGWSVLATVLGIMNGGVLRPPFEVLLVAWAFLGGEGFPGRAAPASTSVTRGAVLTAVAVPLLATMGFGYLVFGWGGLLDVQPEDLVGSLAVECGPAGAGLPAEVPVRYSWSWSETAPLPNDVDTVVIGWSGEDAEGRPLYILGNTDVEDLAIRPGQRGSLGAALVHEARAGSQAGFQFAVDLNKRGYQPGEVDLVLMRAREQAAPVSITVRASYVHLGLWRTEAAPVTCTW